MKKFAKIKRKAGVISDHLWKIPMFYYHTGIKITCRTFNQADVVEITKEQFEEYIKKSGHNSLRKFLN